MAYTKTTWNNLSSPPINAENLNKIEQGIYDNSLGIDKINPSGTATTTAEIEEGQISDVIGLKSLKLKGQTSQYTTTGKNLCNEEFVQGTFNGTTTTRISCRNIELKANTTYTLSSNLNYSNFNISAVTSTNTFPIQASETPSYDSGWKSATFSFTTGADNVYCNIAVRKSDNSNITPNEVDGIHFQLEQGSSATSYEKYSGGKASPNPDFPQDVNNVSGDNVVRISNKNILPNPIQSQTLNGITITRNSDGTLLINGTATANTYFDFSTDFDTTKYAGYKFYGFPDNPGFFIRISKSNRVALQDISSNGTVISDNGTGNHIAIRIAGGADVNNRVLSPMIIAPTITDTTYTAHQGNDFEINLGDIEICKIGAYADYIYKKDGKWYKHKEIGSQTFNGSENWYTVSTNQSNKYRAQFNLTSAINGNVVKPSSNANAGILLCDYYTNIMAGTQGTYGANEGISLDVSGYVQTYNDDYNTNDISLYKTWLASNNITIYWVYATPIDEEITYAPLLRQLDELYNSGLYDETNISQDNSNEAFILDLEACKNNINGIVEYIRR